ncbi:MAG: hypothetical protein UY05_C0037G0004 [Candidatus Peregrinibacteria bacterium GW2011_GWA2_47_7]|nr:MAG: hypothetical protein UY05_C0037G0004 [Candidatus Peregrinibacteria bacterium GW2011_GWA2_47_7]
MTFIAIGLPLLGWFTLKESGTDGTASGYDLSSYVSALKDVFHSLPNFKKAFLLALYQSSFYIIATFFLFIPLLFAGIFFFPKEERRALAPLSPVIAYTVLCSLLFLGGSVLHQYIFAPKVADRYLLFGRYIEPTVPLFILLGGIIYFYYKRSFALNVKLKSFVLFGGATAAAVVFLPVSYYDIVNNISLLYVRGQNVLQEFPVVWIWLLFSFFFFFFFPARWVKHAVLLLIVLFSSWTLLQAYPLANEPSQKYAQQIEIPLWISSNVEGGAVIGFDADQSWEKNLMQFYWLYEFWLGKNYHLAHVRVEDFEGSYFISTKEIAQPLVAAEKENSLKLYRVR